MADENATRRRTKEVQTTNQITGSRRWWALGAVMISMFFSSLSQTSVSTAMPTIIGDLHGFDLYAWVFTAYILAASATVPLYGKLSDTFGRKPFYLFGLIVYLLGSIICGLAQSMPMLIFARAVQGIGGGGMMSMPRATIGDIFNPRERGRWMGLIMGVFGLATLIGPALGGWITDHLSWHWVFYINIPVALVALGMIMYSLPRVHTGNHHHVDWRGSLILVCGLIPMLLGFTWGGGTYAWGSWQELVLFAFSAAMLGLFVLNERRAEEPIIQIAIFGNLTFSLSVLISLLVMMTMFAANMFLPLYVQGVLGISAQSAGFILTPMMLTFVLGSIIGGQLVSRTGRYKVMCIVGGVFLVIGAWLLTQLGPDTSWQHVVVDMVMLGLGIGALMPTMGTVVQNLFPYRMLGTVNATQQAVNTMAGAIAAPVFGTILATRFAARLPQVMPGTLKQALGKLPASQREAFLNPQSLTSSEAQSAIHQQFAAFGATGDQLYQGFIRAVHVALSAAVTELYTLALIFAVLAFIATWILREVPLKTDEFYKENADAASKAAPAATVQPEVRTLPAGESQPNPN